MSKAQGTDEKSVFTKMEEEIKHAGEEIKDGVEHMGQCFGKTAASGNNSNKSTQPETSSAATPSANAIADQIKLSTSLPAIKTLLSQILGSHLDNNAKSAISGMIGIIEKIEGTSGAAAGGNVVVSTLENAVALELEGLATTAFGPAGGVVAKALIEGIEHILATPHLGSIISTVTSELHTIEKEVVTTTKEVSTKIAADAKVIGNEIKATTHQVHTETTADNRVIDGEIKGAATDIKGEEKDPTKSVSTKVGDITHEVITTVRTIEGQIDADAKSIGTTILTAANTIDNQAASIISTVENATGVTPGQVNTAITDAIEEVESCDSTGDIAAVIATIKQASDIVSAAASKGNNPATISTEMQSLLALIANCKTIDQVKATVAKAKSNPFAEQLSSMIEEVENTSSVNAIKIAISSVLSENVSNSPTLKAAIQVIELLLAENGGSGDSSTSGDGSVLTSHLHNEVDHMSLAGNIDDSHHDA